MSVAAYPHPALRATFSRKREKGRRGASFILDAPPLPLAGEGKPHALVNQARPP